MMRLRIWIALMVLCLIGTSVASIASDGYAGDKIVDSCVGGLVDIDSKENEFCEAYLSGFIDGAALFDQLYIDHLYKEHADSSLFFQRAYKTRVGVSPSSPSGNEPLFCLPDEVVLHHLVNEVRPVMSQPVSSRESLQGQVLAFLQNRYPCQ